MGIWILAFALAALLPVAALVIYGFHPIKRWRYRHIPGPRPRWLIGNLLDIHNEGQEGAASRWAREYGPVWCLWMGAWPVVMTDDPELARKVLARPARHKIWCLHRGKEQEYEGHTLFFANGERWRASRKAWEPFFSRPAMQRHSMRMAESAQRLCGLLQGASESGAEVDIWRSLGQLTMDVVGTTVFGVTFNTLAPPDKKTDSGQAGTAGAAGGAAHATPAPADGTASSCSNGGGRLGAVGSASADALLGAVRTVFEVCGPGNPYFALCFLFPELEGFFRWLVNTWPNAPFRRELAARKTVLAVGAELLQQSKQQQQAGPAAAPAAAGAGGAAGDAEAGARSGAQPGSGPTAAGEGGQGNRRDPAPQAGLEAGPAPVPEAVPAAGPSAVDPGSFLAVIGRSTGKRVGPVLMDDQWATNQATTFLSAGYETIANCLAFCIYLLATNPDKESKFLAEIDAFGRDRSPTAEDMEAHFPYAMAVVWESMRVFPPSVTALRETAGPWQLGGYDLPAGTALQVSIYSMHRSERYWRDPLSFKPERFLPGTPEAEEVLPGAYIPFGAGSRLCVGAKFAELETAVSLIRLYQQYTFRLLPGQVPLKTKTVITHGPAEAVRVTVHRRS